MTSLDLLIDNERWVASRAGVAFAEMLATSPDVANKLEVVVDDPDLWDRELEFIAATFDGVVERKVRPRDPTTWDPGCLNNKFLSGGVWPMLMVYYHGSMVNKWAEVLRKWDKE